MRRTARRDPPRLASTPCARTTGSAGWACTCRSRCSGGGGRMLQSGGRVVALDSRQDMFTWRRVPMLGLQMGEQCVRKMVGVVAREGLLAARAAQRESVHGHQSRRHSVSGRRTHSFAPGSPGSLRGQPVRQDAGRPERIREGLEVDPGPFAAEYSTCVPHLASGCLLESGPRMRGPCLAGSR